DYIRVIRREALVGVTLGLLLGTLGLVGATLFFEFHIGLVIGTTLLVICTLAATVGSIMPLIASKIGVDPAVFSNPFISTVVDDLGLVIFFLLSYFFHVLSTFYSDCILFLYTFTLYD